MAKHSPSVGGGLMIKGGKMSCEECEKMQRIVFGAPETAFIAYVRVGNGNVAIVGCDKHLKELLEKLRRD